MSAEKIPTSIFFMIALFSEFDICVQLILDGIVICIYVNMYIFMFGVYMYFGGSLIQQDRYSKIKRYVGMPSKGRNEVIFLD